MILIPLSKNIMELLKPSIREGSIINNQTDALLFLRK